MTEAQWAALERYVTEIAARLRVSHWRIKIDREACTEVAWASIVATRQKFYATLRVCPEWTTLAPEIKRECIVHELLHVHWFQVDDVLECDLVPLLPSGQHSMIWEQFKRQAEYAVDAMTAALAPLFPLPDVPNAPPGPPPVDPPLAHEARVFG